MLNNINLSSINFSTIIFLIVLIAVIIIVSKIVGLIGKILSSVVVIFVIVYFLQKYGFNVPYLGDIVNQIWNYLNPIVTNLINFVSKFKN